jgi:hypothetical protein
MKTMTYHAIDEMSLYDVVMMIIATNDECYDDNCSDYNDDNDGVDDDDDDRDDN